MSDPSGPATQWQALAVAADDGQLFLDAEVAQACFSACDAYISRLRQHKKTARRLGNISGWGDFASGLQLRDILAARAVGGENNMVDVLQSHIDVVEDMKVVFAKFFVAYEGVDQNNAADLRAKGPN